MTENGYPGASEFVTAMRNFEGGNPNLANTKYFNAFSSVYLQNAKTYLNDTNTILDDNLYPSIKEDIKKLCRREHNADSLALCRVFFQDICSGIQKSDLVGEDKDFVRYACSCNMNINEYGTNTPSEQPIACDNTCLVNDYAFPHLISKDGQLQIETCTQAICIISNTDVNIIDSSIGGDVSITNLCGNNCNDGGCICYADSVSINAINSTIGGDINIYQSCGTCYTLQDGDYDNVIEVSCDSGQIKNNNNATQNLTSFSKTISDNRYWLLPLFASLFALALLVTLIVLFIPRKATTQNIPNIHFQDLPTENGYTYQDYRNNDKSNRGCK